MTSDSLANSQLVPDAAAFLDNLLPVKKLPPLEEPAVSPSELFNFSSAAFHNDLLPENKALPPENIIAPQEELTAPDAAALSPDMLPIDESFSPEAQLILSTEPITSYSSDFPPAGNPLPPDELTAPPSEVSVPDATVFLGDMLSTPPPPTPDGLLAPSKALSIQRELDNEGAPKLGERAGSVVGQGILVSNLRLFVRFDQASEVSEMTRIFRLPGTPKWVCGLANLHGNLVPVLDIASFFNLPNEVGEKTMLLVLGHEENALAVTVNGIPERLRFNEDDRIPAPLVGEHLQPYVPGAFTRGNDIWLELEHESLLKALAISLAS